MPKPNKRIGDVAVGKCGAVDLSDVITSSILPIKLFNVMQITDHKSFR